jgi:hypothetical protein
MPPDFLATILSFLEKFIPFKDFRDITGYTLLYYAAIGDMVDLAD